MPYVNVTKSEIGSNAGSCRQLVAYLEKENQGKSPDKHELWFDQVRENIHPSEVTQGIDSNIAKLKKTEAKFFLVNISPSEKELAHLGNDPAQLKVYARQVMEQYAANFQKGIEGKDLRYYGKVEFNRSYKWTDEAVKQGEAIRGDLKGGNQMHVQIIVSRKDRSNTRLLSPLNNSSGRNTTHSQKFGQFNQVNFKQGAELAFDRQFNYKRDIEEQFGYRNIMKNGSVSERADVILAVRDREEAARLKAHQVEKQAINQHQQPAQQKNAISPEPEKTRRKGYGL